MVIKNGVAYAGGYNDQLKAVEVKALEDMMLIVTFSNGEKRLFDVTQLLSMPAFSILEKKEVYHSVAIEYGVVVWNEGELDIAPETMYAKSFKYEEWMY